MISKYKLETLLIKYGLDIDKILTKNNNILEHGEYLQIDKTLHYLINVCKINPRSVEKAQSIMYRNTSDIEKNMAFLAKKRVNFKDLETCLHILGTDVKQLQDTYNYIEENNDISLINKTTSILAVPKSKIIDIENLNIPNITKEEVFSIAAGRNSKEEVEKIIQSEEYAKYSNLFTSEVLARAKLEEIRKILRSKEFEKYPNLFTSEVLSRAKLEEIKRIIESEEFKNYPDLFTSEVLARAKLSEIKKIIKSEEFKNYPHLFTSEVLAKSKLEEIKRIIESEEFKKYPHLFTSEVLSKTKLKEITKIIESEEFKSYPELFSSQVLARAKLSEIIKMIKSEEFKNYPELFTSEVIARTRIEEITKIIESEEFKNYPHLFTSEVIARKKIEEIKKMLKSEEFKSHPELFSSQVLARTTLEDIKKLLSFEYWNESRYKKLLVPTIVAKSKSMIKKLPVLIEIAEEYRIDKCLNTRFLLKSPSQNYALINFLLDNNESLIIDNSLNPIFNMSSMVLKKKQNIDLKKLMEKYPYQEPIESKQTKSK